jgi:hypothetical protein
VPGYAAGPGYPTPALTAAAAAGWTTFQDGLANVTCTSPDKRARLQFGPETVRYARCRDRLWQVSYTADPIGTSTPGTAHWSATFGDNTPAEAIAAFLTTLTGSVEQRMHGDAHTPLYATGPGDPAPVYAACDQAGWTLAPDIAEDCRISADTTMRLTYRAPHPGHRNEAGWQVAYRPIDTDRRWSARFTATVPAAAIAAFLRVLTDPAGLDPDRT